jgi:hypothetical protein
MNTMNVGSFVRSGEVAIQIKRLQAYGRTGELTLQGSPPDIKYKTHNHFDRFLHSNLG